MTAIPPFQVQAKLTPLRSSQTLGLELRDCDTMKLLPLTKGFSVMVDDEDYDFLNQWKWTYQSGYACRNATNPDKTRKPIKMHRLLMNPPDTMEVDHIDGNGINNQKSNLRICSHAENCKNQKVRYSTKTGFKGVDFHTKSNKYRVRITRHYKVHHVGFFSDLQAAVKAYNEASVWLHRDFARPNSLC